MVLMYLENLAK